MGLFHKRPLALAALLFLLSGALAYFFDVSLWFWVVTAALLTASIVIALLRKSKRIIPILLIVFLMASTGFIRSYSYRIGRETILEKYCGRTADAIMTVTAIKSCAIYLTVYEATITEIDSKDVNVDVIFKIPYEDGLKPGIMISATVTFSDFSDDDTFNEKLYYNSKGIFMTAEEADGTEYRIITRKSDINRAKIKMNELRAKFTSALNRNLPEKTGLPAAVFLGDRSGLTDVDSMNFRRTGTYHLLALSGMHLTVLAGIIDYFLRLLSLRKGKRLVITALTVIFYVALTGFTLSVVRAALMLLISYIAYFVRRENDSLTALLLAGAGICAISPNAISDVGFILSLATTFGIMAFYPAIEAKIVKARRTKIVGGAIHYILSTVGISVVALMTSLPVSWLYFGKLTLLSPIGTLLLSSLVSALMLLTPLTMLLGSVPLLGEGLGYLTVLASKATSQIASFLSKPDRIELSLDYEFTPFFFIPFFAVILVIIFFKLKHLKFYFLAAFIIILCFCITHAVYVPNTNLSASFLTYGENEYFIVSKGGQNSVIDLSDGSYGKMSRAVTKATSVGYCQIDALILTHYHTRHVSSVSRLTKNYPVGQIILPEPISETEAQIALSIIDVAKNAGIEAKVYTLESGFTLFGETQITLDRDYVYVSTHPILALDFAGEADISYFGSSYAAWREVTTARENVILGTHGPVAKKEFFVPFSANTRLISFADKGMAELMSKDCPRPPDNCGILLNPTMIKIK